MEVFLLTVEVIAQVFHFFQRGDAFEEANGLEMLPCLVYVYADLLLEEKDFCKGDVSLAEMLDGLHQ